MRNYVNNRLNLIKSLEKRLYCHRVVYRIFFITLWRAARKSIECRFFIIKKWLAQVKLRFLNRIRFSLNNTRSSSACYTFRLGNASQIRKIEPGRHEVNWTGKFLFFKTRKFSAETDQVRNAAKLRSTA